MKRKDFDRLINGNSFSELFITEMGWNNPSSAQSLYIKIDEMEYEFRPVAEKSGFQVYSCEVDAIPVAADCKKIDNQLRRYGYDYICVFVQRGTSHHLWLTPVKTNEKRELVKTEYLGAGQADFLFSKVDDLSFGLTERVLISDVKARVHGSFHLNSEKVTKDFYAQFRKEHTAFKKHITGIDDDKNRDWYASVMLNRLMFCYFIQKKGFLDTKFNYLQEKLHWVKQQQGEDKFFGTFYKGFLCALFHDGLNNPSHDSDKFLKKYGRIPYLNGGMFDDHQLERENRDIDIADVAFEQLFNFFDKWNWHLDTRLTASGKDINPDVLGYIFEQYINDRAAMGAYYTKEDITEYIGKNCILPFLMDKTAAATQDSAKAFEPNGWIWQMLRESGDKYIYDAVKKGYSPDWQQRIPEYINKGIDTTKPNLLERRNRWNEKTHEEFALPTEIWRETIERLQRCDSLLSWIKGDSNLSPLGGAEGGSPTINDFITYNLDIRQFVEDLIRQTQDHLFVGHFYHALQNVTILDPTCGSGAFLFAALNILEPLYEACLDRMEEFHRKNPNLFVRELEEINAKYSSNRQYFIYKSIILRNLYGVDIMVEATEIAKLRLFLKMVAVVEVDKRKDNLGLDPLPDIDFNIKCGNTLVGYATEAELDKALAYGDIFAAAEFKEDIDNKMNIVAIAYNLFRSEQLKTYDDNATIKQTKDELKKRLSELNDLLNHHMYTCIARGTDYNAWLASHLPFHWLAEFYQIIHGNGGFDVIIGNPPYVECQKIDYRIEFTQTSYSNLYAYCIERCSSITYKKSRNGLIVPMSVTSIREYSSLRKYLQNHYNCLFFTNHSIRPVSLFNGVSQRVSIVLFNNSFKVNTIFTTPYIRSKDTAILFQTIKYMANTFDTNRDWILPKIGHIVLSSIWKKIHKKEKDLLGISTKFSSNAQIYYKDYGETYWIFPFSFCPWLTPVKSYKEITVENVYLNKFFCITNSTLFYLFHTCISDCWHLGNWHFSQFPISIRTIMALKEEKLSESYINNRIIRYDKRANGNIYEYKVNKSKNIIDEIDKVLAKHYGFTEEELDFIINYDIKYRMGDELGGEE